MPIELLSHRTSGATKRCQGGGTGSELMAQAELYAKEKGFAFIRTDTVDLHAKFFLSETE